DLVHQINDGVAFGGTGSSGSGSPMDTEAYSQSEGNTEQPETSTQAQNRSQLQESMAGSANSGEAESSTMEMQQTSLLSQSQMQIFLRAEEGMAEVAAQEQDEFDQLVYEAILGIAQSGIDDLLAFLGEQSFREVLQAIAD